MSDKKDTLFASPDDPLARFTFDERVAGVFRDMIERSVPGYSATVAMIGALAGRYARPGTLCYDLGASLGAGALAMQRHIKVPDVRIIAVDNSAAMVERGRALCATQKGQSPVEWRLEDIRQTPIEHASVAVLNFTLQFLPPEDRLPMIRRVFKGLSDGGVLILSEKIRFQDEAENQRQIEWHHTFKEANGYSRLEIAQKRSALENVLIPETTATHIKRLKQAGFSVVHQWFQSFNFISLIAVKDANG
ncbi:MAG: carboxy-S-adenosyl-L-methionine synthase CmoA [Calditrichaeota bacterium]|nr:MAG: carboxy-S-adenosyl-L-methionine synthase CmoA [Calditrichota bacterium]